MIEVFGINVSQSLTTKQYNRILTYISKDRVKRASRFLHYADSVRCVIAEILSRIIICDRTGIDNAQLSFERGACGKPSILANLDKNKSTLEFNISHSEDWVVLSIDNYPVGIDIEKIRNIDFSIAERFFSKTECEDLFRIGTLDARRDYFFELWALKESYMKADGRGFSIPLESFSIRRSEVSGKSKNDEYINYCLRTDDLSKQRELYFRMYQIDKSYKCSVCARHRLFLPEAKILTIEWCLGRLDQMSHQYQKGEEYDPRQ